jgi:hypothetical protein
MAAILGDVRLDGGQLRDLMAAWITDGVACVQPVLAMATRLRDQMHGLIRTLGGNQWARMPRMSGLSTGLAATLRAATAFALAAREPIGGWRLRGRRRVLLPQCELPFEIGNPLLVFGVLLPESFVLLPQPLDLLSLARRLVVTDTRIIRVPRCPTSADHARYGTPTVSTCTAP